MPKKKVKRMGPPVGQLAMDRLDEFKIRYAHDPTLIKEVEGMIELHFNWALLFLHNLTFLFTGRLDVFRQVARHGSPIEVKIGKKQCK